MFELKIPDTGNAAFEEDSIAEVQRILRTVAEKLEETKGQSVITGAVFDVNGNKVGHYYFEEREEDD